MKLHSSRLLQEDDMLDIDVREEDFDPTTEIKSLTSGNIGAIATFSGIVSDNSENKDLISMTLEHYPEMTQTALQKIGQTAMQNFSLQAVRIIHRVGRLYPEDNIVFVGCASAHRHAAFDGCRYIMDFLKTDAPFWKSEETQEGRIWVSERKKDQNASKSWLSKKNQKKLNYWLLLENNAG